MVLVTITRHRAPVRRFLFLTVSAIFALFTSLFPNDDEDGHRVHRTVLCCFRWSAHQPLINGVLCCHYNLLLQLPPYITSFAFFFLSFCSCLIVLPYQPSLFCRPRWWCFWWWLPRRLTDSLADTDNSTKLTVVQLLPYTAVV